MTEEDIRKVARALGEHQRDALRTAWIEDSRFPARVPLLAELPDRVCRYARSDWRYAAWRRYIIKATRALIGRGLMHYDGPGEKTARPVRITNDGRAVARYLEERGLLR